MHDAEQRQQATDPCGSYIVQAPAGSGKTEILTQRFLRLLSIVQTPEQIVALTFTRKAAYEMRERILLALQQAAANEPATSSHQQQTLSYAKAALAQNELHQWHLLQQPQRLRVMTIDALCQSLTNAIPLLEKHIPYANLSDKPQRYYRKAARSCLQYAMEELDYQNAITILLQHLDNRPDHILTLFETLLAQRDQWLVLIYSAQAQARVDYEQALSAILQHELNRFKNSITREDAITLLALVRTLAHLLDESYEVLREWHTLAEITTLRANRLARLLLTSQKTLRKSFDHHVGLKRGVCSDEQYRKLKTDSQLLFEKLQTHPDFLAALIRIRNLPEPFYEAQQWTVLQALLTLLPLLAAHLQLTFTEYHEVDFIAVAQQALQALGEEDNPTDLALYLDNTIHHLLIDEFQDTSIQQFQLLSQLVSQWHPQEPKTIFVVGDPMQSIYRFRAAEVGLFLRTRQEGIGSIQLTPLALNSNFRSTDTIVNWINQQFQIIFPEQDDIESGAVSFHLAVSTKSNPNESCVETLYYENRQEEALAIVQFVTTLLSKYPQDDIAILVRSRRQLADIMSQLHAQGIPFQGVEIDLLIRLPHLRDVWTITQALLMPANRLAWLALLRSPWCGISLADLHQLATYAKHQSILVALAQLDRIEDVSEEGRLRVRYVYSVLNQALQQRHQQRLVPWIQQTLQHLHLQAILTTQQQDDLDQYWSLLEQFDQSGQLEDMALFQQEFNALYSKRVVPSRLQIMTIHKSKGLEFDTVILPGLSSKASHHDKPLLRWLKLPSDHKEPLLLSPIKAADEEQCLLYDYLGQLDAEKNQYETQRLLYVAATRAKKRLYALDHKKSGSVGSFRHLLSHLDFSSQENTLCLAPEQTLPDLQHLPIHFYETTLSVTTTAPTGPINLSLENIPRLLGIVAHALLQWTCDYHPNSIAEIPWILAIHHLTSLGLDEQQCAISLQQLKLQFTTLFANPIGRWLIKRHEAEQNEFALLVAEEQNMATKIIDRTFCENNIRWIIDFKTGRDDNETQQKHRQQVDQYAKIFATDATMPIHCGLYYLASNQWVTWQPDALK